MSISGQSPAGSEDQAPRFLESKPARPNPAQAAKQSKQYILLAVLLIVFVVLTVTTFMPRTGKKKLAVQVQNSGKVQAAAPATVPVVVTPEDDFFQTDSLQSGERTSPFMRVRTEMTEATISQELVLQGVLTDSTGSVYVVINEKIVKKGEKIADKWVTDIKSDVVTLRAENGTEETLRMKT